LFCAGKASKASGKRARFFDEMPLSPDETIRNPLAQPRTSNHFFALILRP
jgi:hypothetical protein